MILTHRHNVRRQAEWVPRPFEELIIYEMHVGSFTPEGTFAAAMAKLEHVRDCGFTCIQARTLKKCGAPIHPAKPPQPRANATHPRSLLTHSAPHLLLVIITSHHIIILRSSCLWRSTLTRGGTTRGSSSQSTPCTGRPTTCAASWTAPTARAHGTPATAPSAVSSQK